MIFFSPLASGFFSYMHRLVLSQRLERTPLQTSRVLSLQFYPHWYSACKLQPPQLPGTLISLSVTQQDHWALFHSLLPALQLGDCLQAVIWGHLFLFSQQLYSPVLPVIQCLKLLFHVFFPVLCLSWEVNSHSSFPQQLIL